MSELDDTVAECLARLINFKHENRSNVSTEKASEKGNRPAMIGTFTARRGKHTGKQIRVSQALTEDRAADEVAYVAALRGQIFVHGEVVRVAPKPERETLPDVDVAATHEESAVTPAKSA
jgi:hypothetical protein